MPPEMLANLKVVFIVLKPLRYLTFLGFQPEFVAPFVAAVCHPDGPDASGRLFELGAGFIAEVRWQQSNGAIFKTDSTFTPSAVSPDYLLMSLQLTLQAGKGEMVRNCRLLKPFIVL